MSVIRKPYSWNCSFYSYEAEDPCPPFYFCNFDSQAREIALRLIDTHKKIMKELSILSELTRKNTQKTLTARYRHRKTRKMKQLLPDITCDINFNNYQYTY